VGVAGEEDFRIHGFLDFVFGWTAKVTEMSTRYMPNTGEEINVSHIWRQNKPTHTCRYTNNNPHGSMDIVPGGLFDTENKLHSKVMKKSPDKYSLFNTVIGGGVLSGALVGNGALLSIADHFESRVNKKNTFLCSHS